MAQRPPNRAKALLFYPLGLGLLALYLTFLAAFLANVNNTSASQWIQHGLLPVLLQSLLFPVGLAALKVLACVALLCDRRVVERVSLNPSGRFSTPGALMPLTDPEDEESPRTAADAPLPGAVDAAADGAASSSPPSGFAADAILPGDQGSEQVAGETRDNATQLAAYLEEIEAELAGRAKQQEEEDLEKLIAEELLALDAGPEQPSAEEAERLIEEELAAAEGGR